MLTLALLLSAGLAPLKAQQGAETAATVEMADTFREDGKIYVVVAVVLLVLGGLLLYAVSIDRKISRLEKELHD